MCIVASIKINDKIEKRWLTTTIFSPLHVIILKESIRFRADKESSFIQKIKLL